MAQLPEQSVHPARVGADFDHHVSLWSTEETSHTGSGQLHRPGTIARPIRPQNEDLRLLVAQIASDRLDGTFRHGRSLLGLRFRTNRGTYPVGGSGLLISSIVPNLVTSGQQAIRKPDCLQTVANGSQRLDGPMIRLG